MEESDNVLEMMSDEMNAPRGTRPVSGWSVLLGALAVVLATAITIYVLRQQADNSQETVSLLVRFQGHLSQLNMLEWQIVSDQRISPRTSIEMQKASDQARLTFGELRLVDPGEKRIQGILEAYNEYETSLHEESQVVAARQFEQSRVMDRVRVDPAFQTLNEMVARAIIIYGRQEKQKENSAFLISILIFVGAAVLISLLFRRFEKARLTVELMNAEKKALRNLSAHLESVREDERMRIAREIHDELGQVLTALKMDLAYLTAKKADLSLDEKTKPMLEMIDSTIQTVKRISSELRPGVLDDLGLIAAIEWQACEFQKRTGIQCDISFSPKHIILDKDRSTTIFRIFQEAVTNVIRHAEATRVSVRLEEKNGQILLCVDDNGIGVTEEQISSPGSFGLIGIRERAHFAGGKVKINGAPNRGTSLEVIIPSV